MELSGVRKTFGTIEVLHGIDLQITKGSHAVIFGPSGSGKSTVLRCMNLLEEPEVGSIKFLGTEYGPGENKKSDVKRGKPIELRRKVGMVFQQFNLFPHLSAIDNLALPYRSIRGGSVQEAQERAAHELNKVGLLKLAANYPSQLSGGQQQRLCIARSLAVKPEVLLMDEPCSALDPGSTLRIEETIRELSNTMTIVIVTHNMQQAARVSDQTAFFLSDGGPGRMIEVASTSDIFSNPRDKRTEDYVTGRFG
jgi:ABC-type phosphate transport system ATPase subunit